MKAFIARSILLVAFLFSNNQKLLAQWTAYTTPRDEMIWNIAFADEATVYAVGYGALIKSSDTGRTWKDLLPNISSQTPDDDFFNLNFLNKDTGFVFMGSWDKNVFKTLDGGLTWIDISQPALDVGLLDMQFVSSSIGYATCGYDLDSTLAKTTDGGLTWHRLETPAACFAPMAVHFLNELVGFYGENEIFKTTDGGLTWKLATASPGWIPQHRISAYKFVDAQSGFAITDAWDLYKTEDGGDHWSLVTLPSSKDGGCRGLEFDQKKLGYIAGYAVQALLVSSDGGNSWDFDPSFPHWEWPSCVAVSPGHKVIVGTRQGDVMVKENEPLAIAGSHNLNDLRISPNPTTGKVLIHSTSAIRTIEIINGLGQTMDMIAADKKGDLYEVDLSNYAKGLYFIKAVGENQTTRGKIILQ